MMGPGCAIQTIVSNKWYDFIWMSCANCYVYAAGLSKLT